MFDWLKRLFAKSAPAGSSSSSTAGWDAPYAIDSYRRLRPPTPYELLLELKNVAYSCATLNASAPIRGQPPMQITSRSICISGYPLIRTLPLVAAVAAGFPAQNGAVPDHRRSARAP